MTAAEIIFPTYYELLAQLHLHVRPARYLEIGVHEGHSLAFVQPGTKVIGVDPSPNVANPSADITIVATTSDAFFEQSNVTDVMGGPLDLAFIDGLHLYEQTLRDILNAERHMAPDGVMLVHDCLPIDEATSARDRTTLLWSGDVWKAVVALRRFRPDLAVHTIDAEPTGLAIITSLDSTRTNSIDEEVAAATAQLDSMTYADLIALDRDSELAVVPGSWSAILPLIS